MVLWVFRCRRYSVWWSGGSVSGLTNVEGAPVVSVKCFQWRFKCVGMTAASLAILCNELYFYPYFVPTLSTGSVFRSTISIKPLNRLISDVYVKICFTLFLICFALIMAYSVKHFCLAYFLGLVTRTKLHFHVFAYDGYFIEG